MSKTSAKQIAVQEFYFFCVFAAVGLRTTKVVPVCSASRRAFSDARSKACGAFERVEFFRWETGAFISSILYWYGKEETLYHRTTIAMLTP